MNASKEVDIDRQNQHFRGSQIQNYSAWPQEGRKCTRNLFLNRRWGSVVVCPVFKEVVHHKWQLAQKTWVMNPMIYNLNSFILCDIFPHCQDYVSQGPHFCNKNQWIWSCILHFQQFVIARLLLIFFSQWWDFHLHVLKGCLVLTNKLLHFLRKCL